MQINTLTAKLLEDINTNKVSFYIIFQVLV